MNTINNIESYQPYYNKGLFWNKMNRVGGKVGSKLLYFARLLYYTLASPSTPLKAKGIIIGALGYFILPLDLIPDLIPLIGFTDDLAAIMAVVGIVNRYSTPEIKAQARKKQ